MSNYFNEKILQKKKSMFKKFILEWHWSIYTCWKLLTVCNILRNTWILWILKICIFYLKRQRQFGKQPGDGQMILFDPIQIFYKILRKLWTLSCQLQKIENFMKIWWIWLRKTGSWSNRNKIPFWKSTTSIWKFEIQKWFKKQK